MPGARASGSSISDAELLGVGGEGGQAVADQVHGRVEPGDDDRRQGHERLVVLQRAAVAAGQDRLGEAAGPGVSEAVAQRPLEELAEPRRVLVGGIGRAEAERRVRPAGGRIGEVEAEPPAHDPQRDRTGQVGHHVTASRRDEAVDLLLDDGVDGLAPAR